MGTRISGLVLISLALLLGGCASAPKMAFLENPQTELAAGSSIPLIDHPAVGASGGSFDVEINDRWIDDQSAFLATYPNLKNAEIKMAVMPSFDRPRAQKYWEDH